MDSRTFLRRVREAILYDGSLEDMRVQHTIGIASVAGADVRIGVTRVEGKPAPGRYVTMWSIATATTDPSDQRIERQTTPGEKVPGVDVLRVPAGKSSFLPDEAVLVVSGLREFMPCIYDPAQEQRIPLQIRPDGIAQL